MDFKDSIVILSRNKNFLEVLTQKANAWGILVGKGGERALEAKILRISLVPRRFNRDLFERVVSLVHLFNVLIDRISMDVEWLVDAHSGMPHRLNFDELLGLSSSDTFIKELVSLAERVYITGGKPLDQDIRLHLLRNDFMSTANEKRILQVEINTISVGFAGIAERLSTLHKSNKHEFYPFFEGELPDNKPCSSYATAMAEAVSAHNSKFNRNASTVVFVVEDKERNFVDQFTLEYCLVAKYAIVVVRKTLSELSQDLHLDAEGFAFVDSQEVALVYYRSGYDPSQYSSEADWLVRERIEKAKCVKVPTLLGQLAGTKKVQQLWFTNNGSVLKRFGMNESDIKSLSEVFAVQTDPSKDLKAREAAIHNPESWILKPQREGGGHNLHGEDLKQTLSSQTPEMLSQYVLMEKMIPRPSPALVIDSQGTLESGCIAPLLLEEAVSELGIFSTYIPQLDKSAFCGHLVRTKDKCVAEGGVNVGFAYLDTISLV
jgi:glutathione synthase